jgi:uncharacterized membrane protein (UPF0182 family)
MRVPTLEPRRRFRFRGWIIGAVIVLIVLLFSLRGLAGFYTDYLWFDSVGQGSTWSSLLAARVAPALVFTIVFFVIMFVNLVIADRLAPKYRSMGPEDELIARYQQVAGPYTMRIRIGVSLFFALIAGIGVSSQWKQWVLFTHYESFHRVDPQFHKDIGFYVFQLPFLKFISEWLFAGLVIVLIVTAVEHYLNGGIRFQSPFQRVTPQVKAHLSVILAVMALVKTAQYYLGRFELNFSTRGVVEGASATDVKAQLPALNLLIFISIGAAALFLWNIRRRGWVLPIIAVGLWAFVSLVIGTIYPAAYQQFKVGPNEYQAESKYIDRNIRATRDAFGLDKVAPKSFDFTSLKSMPVDQARTVIDSNSGTIGNARLWDPNVIRDTYLTLQNLQTYYQIGDVDVDRYLVDGETRQVLIAARGLNSADLPSQSFVNRHIVYTHGYGAVASPSNQADADGNPSFYLRDVPVKGNGIKAGNGPPAQIYFAENLSSYVLTGAKQAEFDYQQAGATDKFTRYKGKDGVKLSNIVRRAAFALRFGSLDPLISGQITSDTKLLMERDIRDRVTKLAPFLQFDADPYPVVLGNRTVWIMDGYTTTDEYPYGQSLSGEGSLSKSFNYVRNSVKVTVDAYQGTVTFYVFDKTDPIIKAYRSAFPDLFTDGSRMPAAIRAHLRYPEDLFKSQSSIFGRYHVTEPKRFYDGSSKWLVSPDPGSGRVSSDILSEASAAAGTASATSGSNQPQAATSTGARISPYYLNIRLPGQKDPNTHFIVTVPFVPVSSGNSQTRLVSFLTADSDPGQYGQLQSFSMPQGQTVLGPVQVNNAIIRTPAISTAITLLNQQGSQIIQGSMQLIPVGNSIVYVRPFYAQGRGSGAYPQFQFVVVFSQDYGAYCAPTVQDGLDQMLGREATVTTCNVASGAPSGGTGTGTGTTTTTTPTTTTPGVTTTTAPPTSTTVPPATGSKQELLNQAAQDLDNAQDALKNGDLAEYQRLVNDARTKVKQAQNAPSG